MPTSTHPSLLCKSQSISAEQLETDRRMLAFDKTLRHLNRRGFLGTLSAATALAALGGSKQAFAQSTGVAITDVLNFALNLEYLEANFYLFASTGSGLSSTYTGGSGAGTVTGGGKVAFTDSITLAVAQALAQDEVNHITTLQAAISSLSGTPVVQPAINLAANGAITTQAQFLVAARQFTSLGASAYAGSAQLLVSNPAVLQSAAQILGAEGQHSGAVNYLCVAQGVTSPAVDAQDVPPSASNDFTVLPTTAIAPARNTSQVLGVVYGVSTATTTTPPTGVSKGGFFPNGLNGNIKST